MKKMMTMFGLVALTGCGTMTSTETVRTPNGEQTIQINDGPYSRDKTVTIDSTAAFRDCLRNVSGQMGSAQADTYCRTSTAAGPQAALGPLGPGMGAMVGSGMYSGLPGVQPIMLGPNQVMTTSATVALERYPGSAVPVPVMNGSSGSAPTSGVPDSALIVKELSTQDKRLCELEKKQGKPCKKQ